MSDHTAGIESDLVEIVRSFKGSDFVEPAGGATALHLFEDFGLDSLDVINLLFQLEEKYGVKISADDIKTRDLMVVGRLASFIAEKK